MGAHKKYNVIIHTLIVFKKYLRDIEEEKYQTLIKTLINSPYTESDKDWDTLPDNKQLATQTNISRTKINQQLWKLYSILLEKFFENPPEINKPTHLVHIGIPWDEKRESNDRSIELLEDEKAIWVGVQFYETPKIGEEIELDFLEGSKYRRGYVHEVRHTISGYHHEIYIHVHPFKNEYYKWQKMKKKYDIGEQRKLYWQRNRYE